MKKPINSRNKGAAGERELCRIIENVTGCRLARNLQQSRSGGHDVDVIGGNPAVAAYLGRFSIEIKRARYAPPAVRAGWWAQAEQQAAAVGKTPLLAHRRDRESWRVTLPIATLSGRDVHTGTTELSLHDFLTLAVNEGLS